MKTQSNSKKFEGQCKFCGQDFSKQQIVTHLDKCEKRISQKNKNFQNLRLGIYDTCTKEFWLIVEINKMAKFKDLDKLIRDVWVECCGHLSLFGRYGAETPKSKIIFDILRPDSTIPYIYDFGSSTELIIKTLGHTNYKLNTKKNIELVARNYIPNALCIKCNAQATHICAECSEKQVAFLCEKCVKEHNEDKGCFVIKIANSPRCGVCGYEPSEPLDKLF